jgi:dTDP-4-amino-4,6-dideoxygalactose transaminase
VIGAEIATARQAKTTPATSAFAGSGQSGLEGYDQYTYSHLGYKPGRSPITQAACALAQPDRLDEFHAKRRGKF